MFFFPEIHPNPVWLTQLASSSSELDVRPSECPTSLLVFLPPQRVVALEPAPAPAPPPWARAQVPWPWALALRPQALWRGREPAANRELLRCAKDLGQRVVYPIHPVHLVHPPCCSQVKYIIIYIYIIIYHHISLYIIIYHYLAKFKIGAWYPATRWVRYAWYAWYAWYGRAGTFCTLGTVRSVRLVRLVRCAWYAYPP